MKTITFFETRKELAELTGLSMDNYCSALWDAGFNLDDWDWGFVSDVEWNEYGEHTSSYEWWLLMKMGDYCVGYEHTKYNGKHYYLLYHS